MKAITGVARCCTNKGGIISVFLLALACGAVDNKVDCRKETLYARHGLTEGRIKSPDGQKVVAIENLRDDKDSEGYTLLNVKVGEKHFSTRLSGWRTEVLWSPNSDAFALNQTEGGGGIGQRAYVFFLDQSGLRRADVSPTVERAFGFPVKCDIRVVPNTAIIQWLASNRILVAAEVVPVSICECKGTFKTYELLLSDMKILRVHGQQESKTLFKEVLGCELRQADNSCAKSWQK